MSYETEGKEFPVDESRDEEMKALLESWKAPNASASLDHRVMAAYRRETSPPLWKRALASSIRVPLPVAAAVLLLLLASGLVTLRFIRSSTLQVITIHEPPQVKTVEAPVDREKIVTRTVYVERKRSAKITANHQTSGKHVDKARSTNKAITQSQEASGQYFTLADLSGFQPVRQMKIEVIKGAKTDEN